METNTKLTMEQITSLQQKKCHFLKKKILVQIVSIIKKHNFLKPQQNLVTVKSSTKNSCQAFWTNTTSYVVNVVLRKECMH